MNIAIMGSGGVGGYFGARMVQAGEDVTFIARGAHLEAMRTGGLRVEGELLNCHLPQVRATDDPATVGPVELVLMSTKAYDLDASARQIAPMVGEDTVLLPMLNGVDTAERLEAVLGAGRVLGGLCQVSARIAAPGLIRQAGPLNKIIFGEFSGEVTPRVEAVRAMLEGAGIPVEVSPDIEKDLWLKYLFIAPVGGVCAVTQQRLGPVLEDPDTRAMLRQAMEEIHAVGLAKGVNLPADAVANTMKFSGTLPPQTQPSLALSLEQGQKLEVEALNGTAARLGDGLGVPAPVNRFITAALKHRAHGSGERQAGGGGQ